FDECVVAGTAGGGNTGVHGDDVAGGCTHGVVPDADGTLAHAIGVVGAAGDGPETTGQQDIVDIGDGDVAESAGRNGIEDADVAAGRVLHGQGVEAGGANRVGERTQAFSGRQQQVAAGHVDDARGRAADDVAVVGNQHYVAGRTR